jgi:hypothetical protein
MMAERKPGSDLPALDALGTEFARVVENQPARRRGVPSTSLGRAALLALCAVAAATGLALTPPGRAVTRELGELVGIGEPATLPPRDLGEELTDRSQPVVIASGHAPDGTVYEVVANRSVASYPPPAGESEPIRPGSDPVTCLTVDLPRTPALETVEICVGAADREFLAGDVLDGVNFADRAVPGEEAEFAGSKARYVLTALLSPNIEEVELTYEDRSGDLVTGYTDVGHVDEQIAETIGTDDRVGYLVAFLPDDGLPSAAQGGKRRDAGVLRTAELVGLDASGEVVARSHFGRGIADDYARQERERIEEARLRAEIEAAHRRDGLALTRSNVTLCLDALRAGADTANCRELIHEAAARGLFGLSTAGPGGEDVVLPD